MTYIIQTCPKCGTKYNRGVFDGGCPVCSIFNSKSYEFVEKVDIIIYVNTEL